MILKLNNIDVECVIGERADERTRTQRLRVDVELTICDVAAETDRLEDTVDYAALTERICAALVAAKCQMIERAAKVVADVCLAEVEKLRGCEVAKLRGCEVAHVKATVTKFGAIPHLESASATYEAMSDELWIS